MRHLFVLLIAVVTGIATGDINTYNWDVQTGGWTQTQPVTSWDPPRTQVSALGTDVLTVAFPSSVANFDIGNGEPDNINSLTINLGATVNHTSGTLLATSVSVGGGSTYSMCGGVLGSETPNLGLYVIGECSNFTMTPNCTGHVHLIHLGVGAAENATQPATVTIDGPTSSVDLAGTLYLGEYGQSLLTQNQGTVTIKPTANDTLPALIVDNFLSGSYGVGDYTMNGGSLTITPQSAAIPAIQIGPNITGGTSSSAARFWLTGGTVEVKDGVIAVEGIGIPSYAFIMTGGSLSVRDAASMPSKSIYVGTDDFSHPQEMRFIGRIYSRLIWAGGDLTAGAINTRRNGGLTLCQPCGESEDPVTITQVPETLTTSLSRQWLDGQAAHALNVPSLDLAEGVLDVTNGCRVVQDGVPLSVGRLHVGTQYMRDEDVSLGFSDAGFYTLKGAVSATQPAIDTRGITIGPRGARGEPPVTSVFQVGPASMPTTYPVHFHYAAADSGDADGTMTRPPVDGDLPDPYNYWYKFLLGMYGEYHVAEGCIVQLIFDQGSDSNSSRTLGNHKTRVYGDEVDGLRRTEVYLTCPFYDLHIEAAGALPRDEYGNPRPPTEDDFCTGNFTLKKMVLGPTTLPSGTTPTKVNIRNDFGNQPEGYVDGAIYTEELEINYIAPVASSPTAYNMFSTPLFFPLYYLNGGSPKQFIPADANLDGNVDVVDLGILAKNYTDQEPAGTVPANPKKWSEGDFTGDRFAGPSDLAVLVAYYDSTVNNITFPPREEEETEQQHVTAFTFVGTSSYDFQKLDLIFDGTDTAVGAKTIEASGALPTGTLPAVGDFDVAHNTIKHLTVGTVEGPAVRTMLTVQNTIQNVPDATDEALYVKELTIGFGGMFWLQHPLFYLTANGDPAQLWPGDANLDGCVDVVDLGILTKNLDQSGKTWADADFNGDGIVDVIDLAMLSHNYGQGEDLMGGGWQEQDEDERFLELLDMMDYLRFLAQ